MNNYYIELSLDETLSSAELRDKLQIQRYQWEARASRAGSGSEKARRKIEVIDEALQVFENDDKRDAYDIELLRARKHDAGDKVEVDWLDRAWSYYFMGEYGPAEIAARNARSSAAESPSPYVVSAWIEIALYEAVQGDGPKSDSKRSQRRKNARAYADEALVLDELSEDTAEVHHVRGVVFELERSMDKALRSYARALKTAEGAEKSVIQWRIMRVQLSINHVQDACESASELLAGTKDVAPDQKNMFFSDCRKVFDAYAVDAEKLDQLIALFGGESFSDDTVERISRYFSEIRHRLSFQAGIQHRKMRKLEEKGLLVRRLREAERKLEAIPQDSDNLVLGLGGAGLLIFPVVGLVLLLMGSFGGAAAQFAGTVATLYLLVCGALLLVGWSLSVRNKELSEARVSARESVAYLREKLDRLEQDLIIMDEEYGKSLLR